MLLKDKAALVTGAASGIGRAIAQVLAREGASVMVSDVDEAQGQQTAELIREAGGQAYFFSLDVTDPEQHARLVAQCVERFGKLDVACNNAGISSSRSAKPYALLADSDVEDWHRILDVNLSGLYYGLRAQIPEMLRNGGGAIANTASIFSQTAGKGLAAYVASKHGVLGLTGGVGR